MCIRLTGSDKPLMAGETYPITLESEGSLHATNRFSTNIQSSEDSNIYIHNSFKHFTTNQYNGEIIFHHIDEENKIISGEFYFE